MYEHAPEQRIAEPPSYRYVTRTGSPVSDFTACTPGGTNTYNIMLFMLLLIFLCMIILIVTLCKMSQVQKSIEVLAMMVLNGNGA